VRTPQRHGVATLNQEHFMNPFPTAARVSGAAVVLALSGCYYVGPYPYGYYGAAPYPAAYSTQAVPSAATQRDQALGPNNAPTGPEGEPESADPNAYGTNNGYGAAPPQGAQAQAPGPAGVYAPPPVAVAPAYYPAYPAYPAYYPAYYGYGWPGWWGPSVSFRFGFGGGHHHH
jgi:hypothetical protein